jgi:hypothetical protein
MKEIFLNVLLHFVLPTWIMCKNLAYKKKCGQISRYWRWKKAFDFSTFIF